MELLAPHGTVSPMSSTAPLQYWYVIVYHPAVLFCFVLYRTCCNRPVGAVAVARRRASESKPDGNLFYSSLSLS